MRRLELNYSFHALKKEIKIPFPFYRQHLNEVSRFSTSIRNTVLRMDAGIVAKVNAEMRKLPVTKVTYEVI